MAIKEVSFIPPPDPLWFLWAILSIAVVGVGMWQRQSRKTIPEFLSSVVLYGKMGENVHHLKFMQVPKRWFTHFYAFAVMINIYFVLVVYHLYYNETPVPEGVLKILDFLYPSRTTRIDSLSCYLGVLLLLLHTSRRLYECLVVSVYSPATMNVLQYLIGFFYYFGITITLVSEAPGFTPLDSNWKIYDLPPLNLEWFHLMGIVAFALASYQHYEAHVILARLRTDNEGNVINIRHSIPTGGLFEYVSCPHYLAEILVYISMTLVLGMHHYSWYLVVMWVVCFHIMSAIHTHTWYVEKYKEYPPTRKALIPYII